MAEELTEGQVTELSEDLRSLQESLVEQLRIGRDGARPVELDSGAIGRVSRIDAIQQQQMAAAARRSQEIRLQQVDAALGAMRRDEYGLCRACEEPIGYGRLKARPETPLCVSCAGARERR